MKDDDLVKLVLDKFSALLGVISRSEVSIRAGLRPENVMDSIDSYESLACGSKGPRWNCHHLPIGDINDFVLRISFIPLSHYL